MAGPCIVAMHGTVVHFRTFDQTHSEWRLVIAQTSPDDVIPFAQWNASSFSNVAVLQQENPYYTPESAKQAHKSMSSAGTALIVIGCLLVAAAVVVGSW